MRRFQGELDRTERSHERRPDHDRDRRRGAREGREVDAYKLAVGPMIGSRRLQEFRAHLQRVDDPDFDGLAGQPLGQEVDDADEESEPQALARTEDRRPVRARDETSRRDTRGGDGAEQQHLADSGTRMSGPQRARERKERQRGEAHCQAVVGGRRSARSASRHRTQSHRPIIATRNTGVRRELTRTVVAVTPVRRPISTSRRCIQVVRRSGSSPENKRSVPEFARRPIKHRCLRHSIERWASRFRRRGSSTRRHSVAGGQPTPYVHVVLAGRLSRSMPLGPS